MNTVPIWLPCLGDGAVSLQSTRAVLTALVVFGVHFCNIAFVHSEPIIFDRDSRMDVFEKPMDEWGVQRLYGVSRKPRTVSPVKNSYLSADTIQSTNSSYGSFPEFQMKVSEDIVFTASKPQTVKSILRPIKTWRAAVKKNAGFHQVEVGASSNVNDSDKQNLSRWVKWEAVRGDYLSVSVQHKITRFMGSDPLIERSWKTVLSAVLPDKSELSILHYMEKNVESKDTSKTRNFLIELMKKF